MKRSIQLILLLAFSGGFSVAHLITQNQQLPTLEADVKSTLKELYITLNDNPVLEKIPDWIGEAAVTCAKNFQENGVTFFHFKTLLYIMTIISVILMFLWKRIGFYIYVLAQIGAMISLFVAFKVNTGAIALALLSGLLSLIMILFYKKHFLKPLDQLNM
ncbi:MAG: hypothetical protein AB8B53_01680 [Flavobacteriales bacterium]